MQVKKTIIPLVMLLSCNMSVKAQILLPDPVPSIPSAQPRVHLLPPIKLITIPIETEIHDTYSQFADNVVSTAMKYIGARYARGAMGPKYFDCSGFTTFIYKKNNVKLNRSSRSQYTQGIAVSVSELQKGDLVFYGGSRNRKTIGHVGIVTSVEPEGRGFSFIHATHGLGITISKSSEPYYSSRYIGARRIVNP